jgi:hypothetical protein
LAILAATSGTSSRALSCCDATLDLGAETPQNVIVSADQQGASADVPPFTI